MTYTDQLTLILIDKLAIGLIVLVAGFFLNRILKHGELKTVLENKLQELRQSFTNDLAKLSKSKRIDYTEKQLSQFYWPLYVRWFTIEDLRATRNKLLKNKHPSIKTIVDQEVKIQAEMMDVAHANMHLMDSNNTIFEGLRKLGAYSACLQAEINTVSTGLEPDYLSNLWPSELRTELVK